MAERLTPQTTDLEVRGSFLARRVIASPQTSFGVCLSRNKPQRTSAGRLVALFL